MNEELTINNLIEWKQQFGDIYQLDILEQTYIFRALGREEYKEIVLLDLDLGEFQEVICSQVVIYPYDYDYSVGIAGIAEILSDGILDVSGLHLQQAKELLDQYREEMVNYDYQVDCMIHEAFPEYPIEVIASWPVRKTMYYLSRAEWILQNLKGIRIESIDETMMNDAQQQQGQYNQQMQREMPKQNAQYENQFTNQQTPPQNSKKTLSDADMNNEAAVLAMLAESGAKVTTPATNFEEVHPELGWFKHQDELKGEFD
ncbi:hypothetical protein P4I85_14405 [Bacillus cereus]|uniref:hypothetical protein n=1 Tax=Bacillus thuringiensis TaxID=1428 RepID=UPI0012989862|nr:hypothetical protein [Bacillus thuringiensis]MEB9509586.1 hypothetical protein [Bacillus cereus]MEB9561678.1 hypothetical protein [Bacillus cereus]MRC02997.1 hypothetical protein [Bacillus thuringiensis]